MFSNREALREYVDWMRPDGDFNLFFLLGKDAHRGAFTAELQLENAKNDDLIIGDFVGEL